MVDERFFVFHGIVNRVIEKTRRLEVCIDCTLSVWFVIKKENVRAIDRSMIIFTKSLVVRLSGMKSVSFDRITYFSRVFSMIKVKEIISFPFAITFTVPYDR